MRLEWLEVENYRNIAHAQLDPGDELTVLCGDNGQGKTNLLEAIWLLTGGKSFRGGKDAELVRRGQPFAVLSARTRAEDAQEDKQVRLTVGLPAPSARGGMPRWGICAQTGGGAGRAAFRLWCSTPDI